MLPLDQWDWVGLGQAALMLLKLFGGIAALMLVLGLFTLPRLIRHDREVQAYKRSMSDEFTYKPPAE